MQVRFAALARAQYLEALAYVREQSPAAASKLQERAERMIVQLREHPRSGHAIPKFPDHPHREVMVSPYRFFYRIDDRTVWIVGVWHGRRVPDPPDDDSLG